jgi:hypothetical protein
MPLPHKNSGNEYLVHTDANVVKTDAWNLFQPSKESKSEAKSEAELKVDQLEQELYEFKKKYHQLDLRYKQVANELQTMQEVANELQCLKVHDYFLQMHLPPAQKKQMEREKEYTREKLQRCMDDETYRKENKQHLKSLFHELMDYMQKRHDDYNDKAIFTQTDFIKYKDMLY